jgi:DNA-binding response OmpR family regulator
MGVDETVVQVVDDDPAIVRLVRRYLEREGFRVIAASDGKTALSQFDREEPNLVVPDIGLPDVDGLEVSRRSRAKSDVPVIMLTARAREEEVIEGFDAGADDYLAKPFSPGVLLALLAQHRGKVVTSAQILTEVWGSGYVSDSQILRLHISIRRGRHEYRYLQHKGGRDCACPGASEVA